MKEIYKVVIRGRKLESPDLRLLLARAVREKRDLDRRLRVSSGAGRVSGAGWTCADPDPAAYATGLLR